MVNHHAKNELGVVNDVEGKVSKSAKVLLSMTFTIAMP